MAEIKYPQKTFKDINTNQKRWMSIMNPPMLPEAGGGEIVAMKLVKSHSFDVEKVGKHINAG